MTAPFAIARMFSAPRQRVWDAWTQPDQFAQWFAPPGAKASVQHFDFRPGGYLHSRLEAPDGSISWGRNSYRAIDAPSRIVWDQGWSNAAGEIVPAPFPMPWPLLMRTTVAFDEQGADTHVTLHWEPIDATAEQSASFAQMIPSMTGGWTGTFDQLAAFLAV
jgi:uncharacterized protein YndB with AHSA1/START domain